MPQILKKAEDFRRSLGVIGDRSCSTATPETGDRPEHAATPRIGVLESTRSTGGAAGGQANGDAYCIYGAD
ncbi:MAG TPA: hypothetical protein V6D46_04685 [Coleofasciculaceae cyanobacterium]